MLQYHISESVVHGEMNGNTSFFLTAHHRIKFQDGDKESTTETITFGCIVRKVWLILTEDLRTLETQESNNT